MSAVSLEPMALEQDRGISEVIERERSRLREFIRRRVPDARDAEDILQDVFFRLVEANRLLMPIDHLTGWLFQVTRNRIVDLFRERREESLDDRPPAADESDSLRWDELIPSREAGPEAIYARRILLDELERALDDLPKDQRDVFIAHELEGRSFKEIARDTGANMNTLLSRKRYAVLHLRERLRQIHDDLIGE